MIRSIRDCLPLGLIALSLLVGRQACGQEVEPAHFHHVVINAVDPQKSIEFYRTTFGAVPIKFRGVSDGLFVERSFILFNKVDQPASSKLDDGIWHIGWGGVDVPNEYEWWKNHGREFQTPATPLGGNNYYMYFYGPDKELIEINTMGHHHFAHVHFFCKNVYESADWYVKHLGQSIRGGGRGGSRQTTEPTPSTTAGSPSQFIYCDNVTMIFYGAPGTPNPRWWPDPPLTDFQPTTNHAIDRIGFSYRKIEPVYERMKAAGVKILEPLAERPQFKLKSFTVEGPNKVAVEIVEAKPIPEGTWD